MAIPASSTYLFDQFRTGRLLYAKGDAGNPSLAWSLRLPNNPPCSPESTAVFDQEGNLYFGCHDGCFYSVDREGHLRWSFPTDAKIYSSPAICYNSATVCFVSGDGWLYCLALGGSLLWKVQAGKIGGNWIERSWHRYHEKKSPSLHEVNRIASAKAWASPLILPDGLICVTGYRLGLTAVNCSDGKVRWRTGLGWPSNHLTGVAVTADKAIIAVGQQGQLLKVCGASGSVEWQRRLKYGYNHWGNPSIDPESGAIHVISSHRESRSTVWAINSEGRTLWRTRLPEASRGAVAISRREYVICCGFKGNLYFLHKESGEILRVIRVTQGKLWTSCSIDPNGYIFVSVIDSSEDGTGRLCCLDHSGEAVWDYDIGKGHSVPVIDHDARAYCGSWRGMYYCLQT